MYTLHRDNDSFSSVEIDPHLPIFCDTETTEDEGRTSGGLYGKIRLFQIYQEHWQSAQIADCFFVDLDLVLSILKPHFLIFHNASYDLHTINCVTPKLWKPAKIGDTLYLSRLKYYTKTKFSFYDCLNHAKLSDELIKSIDKKAEQKADWNGPLSAQQLIYATCDVTYLCKLYNDVKIYEDSVVYKLDIQNLEYALSYSRRGMPINRSTVQKLKKEYITKLEKTLEILPINPRSSVQARKFLGTKSSSSEVLTDLIMKGDQKAKLVQDGRHYYKSLEYLNAYDRPRVKGFFQPCAALSGRFSCVGGDSFDHVNLQQMPETLHKVVEAPEGYVIIYKDYSGLELRMAVAYTGEPVMAELMKSGADMHTETAKYIFNVNNPTDEERTVAKTFNFALIYGAGVKTVRETLYLDAGVTMSFREVKELRIKWFDMYDYFTEWHTIMKHQFDIYGYADVETALGRKVRTYRLTDALNLPIQGSSVEVQKTALGILSTKYPEANLINTIHDSNILCEKENEAEMWGKRLNECMIEGWKYVISYLADEDIPMPGGFEYGPIWVFH